MTCITVVGVNAFKCPLWEHSFAIRLFSAGNVFLLHALCMTRSVGQAGGLKSVQLADWAVIGPCWGSLVLPAQPRVQCWRTDCVIPRSARNRSETYHSQPPNSESCLWMQKQMVSLVSVPIQPAATEMIASVSSRCFLWTSEDLFRNGLTLAAGSLPFFQYPFTL